MRSPPARFLLAFVTVALTTCIPALASTQCPPPPATSSLAEGEIGVFFDPLGTVTCGDLTVSGWTPLYVVMRVPAGGLKLFTIPELRPAGDSVNFISVGQTSLPEDSPFLSLFYYSDCDQAIRPFEQTTCPVAQGDLVVMAHVSVYLFFPVTGTACFETVCPSSGEDQQVFPSTLLYVTCDGVSGTFTGSQMMCIGLGEAPVPVEAATWGAVKAMYR